MDDLTFYALLGGPGALCWGLSRLREKRYLQNIPTSKIRSAAMGLVEIQGQAIPLKDLYSPFSNEKCCWWRCVVEELRQSGKSSSWVVLKEVVAPELFTVEDGTGSVLVDARGAEYYLSEGIVSLSPAGAYQDLLVEWGIASTSGWFGDRQRRVKEMLIRAQQPIYLIGELAKLETYIDNRKTRFLERLREVKSNPVMMAQADTNKDGTVDAQEWDAYRIKQEEQFLQEESARHLQNPLGSNVIRAPEGSAFIIASKSQEDLLSTLAWQSSLGIIGGLLASAYGVWMSEQENIVTWIILSLVGTGAILGTIGSMYKRKGVLSWRLFSWLLSD